MTRRLDSLSLDTKLAVGFGILLVLILVIGLRALHTQRVIHREAEKIYREELVGIAHLKEANVHLIDIGRNVRHAVLARDPGSREAALARLERAQAMVSQEFNQGSADLDPNSPIGALVGEFQAAYSAYQSAVQEVLIRLGKPGEDQTTAIDEISEPGFITRVDRADELLARIASMREESAEKAAERVGLLAESGRKTDLMILALALLTAVLAGFLTAVSVRRPLEDLRQSVISLSEGKLDVTVPGTAYNNEIGSLARSVQVLQESALALESEGWAKSHLSELSTRIQTAETFQQLAQELLSGLAPLLEAGHGVFYHYDPNEKRLVLLASYGYRERKNLSQSFAVGEGLVGQCVLERQPITLTNPPPDYVQINSGLGQATPRAITALPIFQGETPLGVLELAAFKPPSPREQLLLDGILPILALNLTNLARSLDTSRLLAETQAQARRMEAQAAQLEEQAVELDAQQAELKQTEEWYRRIIESAPESMLVLDEKSQIVLSNPRSEATFGYQPGELIGLSLSQLMEDPAELRLEALERRAGIRKDGSRFPLEVSLSSLPSLGGKGTCTCVSLRDITERERVAEELRQATQAAEDATRMKSDFLANMSHEIRTPMNAIIGMAHLALKTELNARQRDYLTKIQQSGQHLLGIINDILDFSKIEAGRLTIEEADFHLEEMLTGVSTLVNEKATAKGLELIFRVAPDVPSALTGDSLRLGQILINYANNAVKFTEKGEIVIDVRPVEQTAQDVLLKISVQDTGVGLTAEQMGRLFQSFQQADTSTSRKYGGTGLGLAISKQLAHLMGGEVGVESEVGRGSTFWFTARLRKSSAVARKRVLAPELRGRRVLVVDDNEAARRLLDDLLSSMELKVDQVASGAEAVDEVGRAARSGKPYEIVFLDWRMPGMDGIETAHAIRALGLEPPPHLIMVTAYAREEVMQQAEQAGLEEFLLKPVTASTLFDSVGRVLGSADESQPAPSASPAPSTQLSRLRGARVLLVEDNELNQEVALGLLAEGELVVDVAENGQRAVEMVRERPYELVLMDMQMPVMDGVTATREIRKEERFRNLPIVAMTANAMQQDRDRCVEAGMNDHLAKPVEPDELYRLLFKYLGAREAAPDVSARAEAALTEPDLPAIEGLNGELGLRRMMGKKKLYLDTLRRFLTQEKAVAEIRQALEKGDFVTAQRVAHTARGVSGSIGAEALFELAAELESAIRDRAEGSVIESRLAPFGQALQALCDALRQALPPAPPPVPAEGADPEKAAALLKELAEKLASGDGVAADLVRDNAGLLQSALGSELYNQLDSLTQGFDFDQALELLQARI